MILSHDKSVHLSRASNLYTGIEDEAKLFLSTRLMVLTAIAETSLNPDVTRSLVSTLSVLQKQEQQYHEYHHDVFGHTIGPTLKTYGEIQSLLSIPNHFDEKQCNEHHIIPRNGHHGIDVVNGKLIYGKAMKYGATKFKTIFNLYKLFTRNSQDKHFIGSMKGSDDEKNIKIMTIERHNNGLNIRYPGNAFFQLQVLLERYAEQKDYRNNLKNEFSQIDEIERILSLCFSELHHKDCYIIKEQKKKSSNDYTL